MAIDPLVGKVLADRFEILERIGEGGTGVVYRAKQVTIDRVCAIKVLADHVSSDPSWVNRFHNEARAAAKLRSQHTVGVIDFGQTKEGRLFIAMELLLGHSLRDELERVGKMPIERALQIIAQASESVAEAHVEGIIHRDLKPDNLYLCDHKGSGDFVKVLDFSVAKLNDNTGEKTRIGVVFGTPAYMSPEQGRGGNLGPGSDIYALGICLYEMVSGKPPFDSQIPTDVLIMHIKEKPAPIPGIPEPVARVIFRALDKEPTRRQASCEQLGEECRSALAQLRGPSVPTAAPATPAPVPQAAVEQKTMFAMDAPSAAAPRPRTTAARPVAVAAAGGAPAVVSGPPPSAAAYGSPPATPPGPGSTLANPSAEQPQGTMMLPDSAGVVAFAVAQAEAARAAAVTVEPDPVRPPGPLFWAAWAVLGIGLGLAIHFLQVHSQLQTG